MPSDCLLRGEQRTMKCPNCGYTPPNEAEYCIVCFERLEQARQGQFHDEQPDALAAPPEEELRQIREELAARIYVRPWDGMCSTSGAKAIAVVAGGAGSLIAAYVAGFFPIPFIGLLVPLPMGVFVGWMVKNRGGAWALPAAGIPAAGGTVVAMRRTIIALARMVKRILGYYYAAHLPLADTKNLPPSLVAGAAVIAVSLLAFAVAIPLLLAYWGGTVGERIAKGPGYGI